MTARTAPQNGKSRLSPATQKAFDALAERRGVGGAAKTLGLSDSQVDRLLYGGTGSPELVAKIENAAATGGLAA